MKKLFTVVAIVAGSIGVAYAASPQFVEACCECCKGLLECCCD